MFISQLAGERTGPAAAEPNPRHHRTAGRWQPQHLRHGRCDDSHRGHRGISAFQQRLCWSRFSPARLAGAFLRLLMRLQIGFLWRCNSLAAAVRLHDMTRPAASQGTAWAARWQCWRRMTSRRLSLQSPSAATRLAAPGSRATTASKLCNCFTTQLELFKFQFPVAHPYLLTATASAAATGLKLRFCSRLRQQGLGHMVS